MASLARRFAPPAAGSTRQRFNRLIILLPLIGAAVLVGSMVAHEQWIYLGLITAGVIALQWPIEAALGMYILIVPFDAVVGLGQGESAITVNYILGALAAVALLGAGVLKGRLHWPLRAALWWTLFVAWGSFSVLWALQPTLAIHALPTALSLLGLYLITTSWRITERQYSLLIKLTIIGACLASCFVIYQFVNGVTWRTWQGAASERASLVIGGREVNPNRFGADLLLPFSLALGAFFSASERRKRLVAIIAAGIIAYASLLTVSRGCLLSIALILAVFALHKGMMRKLVLCLPLLAVLMLGMPSSFFQRLTSTMPSGGSGRLGIWVAGLFALQKYGLAGAGLSNFSVAYNEFAGHAAYFIGLDRAPHNLYLEAGVELGVLGFVLLGIALYSHIRALRRARQSMGSQAHAMDLLALEAACWGVLANGFFEGGLWDKSFWLTWMLCLMAVILYNRKKGPDSSPSPPSRSSAAEYNPIGADRYLTTAP